MVLGWYAKHGRRFVWRVPSPDPYVVLVSEIMLQRTQTSRVQQRLPEFLSQFPDFAALAAADNATVIRAWRGMGYNNRALRLRDCARVVVQQFQGSLPDRRTDLGQLPGLGPYTVGAILSFAFHQDTVVLDVNIRRLYSRLFLPSQRLRTRCRSLCFAMWGNRRTPVAEAPSGIRRAWISPPNTVPRTPQGASSAL